VSQVIVNSLWNSAKLSNNSAEPYLWSQLHKSLVDNDGFPEEGFENCQKVGKN